MKVFLAAGILLLALPSLEAKASENYSKLFLRIIIGESLFEK